MQPQLVDDAGEQPAQVGARAQRCGIARVRVHDPLCAEDRVGQVLTSKPQPIAGGQEPLTGPPGQVAGDDAARMPHSATDDANGCENGNREEHPHYVVHNRMIAFNLTLLAVAAIYSSPLIVRR
jgi:hypothetical protein